MKKLLKNDLKMALTAGVIGLLFWLIPYVFSDLEPLYARLEV